MNSAGGRVRSKARMSGFESVVMRGSIGSAVFFGNGRREAAGGKRIVFSIRIAAFHLVAVGGLRAEITACEDRQDETDDGKAPQRDRKR